MTTYIVTQAGYAATLDLAARMGTPGAQEWAERKRPGTPIEDPQERWIELGWVEPTELTLF